MYRIDELIIVQYFLHEANSFRLDGTTAFLGPNGSGKSSTLDAIQTLLVGAHGNYMSLNARALSAGRARRTLSQYCLGEFNEEGQKGVTLRARDSALTYITAVLRDRVGGNVISIGLCASASVNETKHRINGLFILPGVELTREDHLEKSGNEERPLPWEEFRQMILTRAEAAGRSPIITDHSETFVRNLLHMVQPRGRTIDAARYMMVFKRTLNMKGIEAISDYVRDYVIEDRPVQIGRFWESVDQVKQLTELIRRVEEQLGELGKISVLYRETANWYALVASYDALEQVLIRDDALASLGEIERALARSRSALATEAAERDNCEGQIRVEENALRQANARMMEDPELRARHSLQAELETRGTWVENAARQVRQKLLHVIGTLDALMRAGLAPDAAQPLAGRLNSLRERITDGLVCEHAAELVSACELLSDCLPAARAALEQARKDMEKADYALKAAKGRLTGAERGGAQLGDSASALITYLAESRIQASPICDLVRVKDPAWQPALEAVLGLHLQALVVTPGQEDRAISLYRHIPRDHGVYEVTIVRAGALQGMRWDRRDATLAANLIEGENETALNYLRDVLGDTLCAITDEDMARARRAITQDGMWISRRGTTRKRLPSPDHLLIGRRTRPDELGRLREAAQDAARNFTRAYDRHRHLGELVMHLERTAAESYRSELHDVLGNLEQALAAANHARQAIRTAQSSRRSQELIAAVESHEATLKQLRDKRDGHVERIGDLKRKIKELEDEQQAKRLLAEDAAEKAERLMCAQDYDQQRMQRAREEIEAQEATLQRRLSVCQDRRRKAEGSRESLSSQARAELHLYANRYAITLDQERDDWRAARAWVEAEYKRMHDTELVRHKDRAAEALEVAKNIFRRDVAVHLRDRMSEMWRTIANLNEVLKRCPPFTNGERYRFECKPTESMRPLYNLIEQAAGDQGLASTEEGLNKLMELLEATGDDRERHAALQALTDYRQMFSFDLIILRDDQPISRLSNRIGKASGGEHIAPFYVIAGASLASVMRLEGQEEAGGFGVMLMDEAFDGLDEHNSLSVARFLKALGLQVIMATRGSSFPVIATCCDTVYDVARFKTHLLVSRMDIKDPAHELMTSDMPDEHPELVEAELARLRTANAEHRG